MITWARVFLPEQRLSKREVEALSRRERLAAGDEREPAAEILSVAQDLVPNLNFRGKLEARAGIEPAIEVLQTSALPLGYRATEETPPRAGVADSGAPDKTNLNQLARLKALLESISEESEQAQ